MQIIKSKRLLLRQLDVGDVTQDYVRWLNDYETTKYLEIRFTPQTKESIQDYIRQNLSEKSKTLHLGVFDENGRRLVGTVTFNQLDNHHRSASISFVIGHPEAQKKGYGTEAVHAALCYMFFDRKFIKIWGGYYDDHRASGKVFVKNGFMVEGRLRKKLINFKGERVDHVLMGLLSNEFIPDEDLIQGIFNE